MSRWQIIHDAMQFFITPAALLGLLLMIAGAAVGDGGVLGLGLGFIAAPLLVFFLAHIMVTLEGPARRTAVAVYFTCVGGLAVLAVVASM